MAPARAATVPIRASAHPDFGRMVFDWPSSVEFTARIDGNRLVIAFTQPIDAPLDRAVAALPDYLAAGRVESDGKTVSFDLKRPVTLKSFRSGKSSVAIDLTPASAQAAAQPPTPATPAAPAVEKPVASAGKVAVRVADYPELQPRRF